MNWLELIALSFLEGLTEFIPVSSTGHLILLSSFFKLNEDEFSKAFNIVIQAGAILSVLVVYPKQFNWNPHFYKCLACAFVPTAALGFLLKKKLETLLGNPKVVCASLIIGGIVFVFIDKYLKKNNSATKKIEDLTPIDCVKIGLIQSIALIPGVSRSAATLIGGIIVGLNKVSATEFAFFLGVPVLTAASLYKFYDVIKVANTQNFIYLGVGTLIAFFVSLFSLKFLISVLVRYGLSPFGWYRIVVGAVLLYFVF